MLNRRGVCACETYRESRGGWKKGVRGRKRKREREGEKKQETRRHGRRFGRNGSGLRKVENLNSGAVPTPWCDGRWLLSGDWLASVKGERSPTGVEEICAVMPGRRRVHVCPNRRSPLYSRTPVDAGRPERTVGELSLSFDDRGNVLRSFLHPGWSRIASVDWSPSRSFYWTESLVNIVTYILVVSDFGCKTWKWWRRRVRSEQS